MNLMASDLSPEHQWSIIEGWRRSLYDFSLHSMADFISQPDSFECLQLNVVCDFFSFLQLTEFVYLFLIVYLSIDTKTHFRAKSRPTTRLDWTRLLPAFFLHSSIPERKFHNAFEVSQNSQQSKAIRISRLGK
jgi:hypothetical protein